MRRLAHSLIPAAMSGVLLAALALWQILWPVRANIPAPAAKPAASRPVASAEPALKTQQPARENFTEIERRPLFVAGRKPPSTAADKPAAGPSSLDRYTVSGIVAAPDRPEAILRGPTGEVLRVQLGQSVEGWTLDAIKPRKLTFTSGVARRDLDLKATEANNIKCRTGPTMVPC